MASENDCIASRTRTWSGNQDTDEEEDHRSSCPITNWKKIKIVDDAGLEEVVAYVKKNRSNVITKDAKLDILMLQAKFRHEHYTKQTRFPSDRNRSRSKGESTIRVASYLMRKKETVAGVWSDYVNGIPLEWSRPAANYNRKTTRVPSLTTIKVLMCWLSLTKINLKNIRRV